MYIAASEGDIARAIAICEMTVSGAADGRVQFGDAAHFIFMLAYPQLFSGWKLVMLLADYFTLIWVEVRRVMGAKKLQSAGESCDDCPLAALVDCVALDGISEISAVASLSSSSELEIFYFWILADDLFGLRFFFGVRHARKRLRDEFRCIAITLYVEENGLPIWGRLAWLIGRGSGRHLSRQMSR